MINIPPVMIDATSNVARHPRHRPRPPMTSAMRLQVQARVLARLACVLGTLACVLVLVPTSVAAAHTTAGNATPSNDGSHPWETNGCSTPGVRVNSVTGIYDFGHACKHHDGCYTGFPRNGQITYWTSRSQCDAWFLYDMQASCRWQHGTNPSVTWAGRQCDQWASNYHWAVRSYGSGGYKGPWND